MKSKFLTLIGCMFCSILWAQTSSRWDGWGISVNAIGGKILKHSDKIIGEIPPYIGGVNVQLLRFTNGSKDWQQRWNYPQFGIGVIYLNYFSGIYGEAIGVYPMIELPLIRKPKLQWVLQAGMGLGYVTKPYQRLSPTNIENTAIGGHLNNVSPFAMLVRWMPEKKWIIQAGLNFTHVSNASFQQPNLGINSYGAQLGLVYFPTTIQPERIVRDPVITKNNWGLDAKVGLAFSETPPFDGPLYPTYSTALLLTKKYWQKCRLQLGMEYYYHTSKYVFNRQKEFYDGKESSQAYQLSALIGHEFLIGRIGIVGQVGYYLKTPDEQKDNFYQKIGGNIYFLQKEKGIIKNGYLSFLLKTHFSKAEIFEMGIGFSI